MVLCISKVCERAMEDCISHVMSITGVNGGLGYGGRHLKRYPVIMHYICSQDFMISGASHLSQRLVSLQSFGEMYGT